MEPFKTVSDADAILVYVGTYTEAKSKGIYLFRLQPEGTEVFQNVTLVPLGLAAETANPSILEIDLKRRRLFAVNEMDEFEGKPTGAVSAFSIDPATGKLTLLNQRASMGKGPCHLVLDHEGRNLLVANYGSGSVSVLPVQSDGRLGEPTDLVQHSGKSVDPDRQEGPHAHCVTLDPANRFAFVCDLGLDKVMAYRYDAEKRKLTPNEPAFAPITPGAGPRHMVIRPDGRFAYVINEVNSTIIVFAYDPEAGALKELQTVSTLPGYWEGANTTAEVEVHPSGKYLFASNRGHNSVVLYTIDPDKGTLTWVEEQGTGGKTPRHFGIEPSGKYLAIANQNSDTVLAARIDAGNGRLKPSGIFASVPSPACVKFLPPPESGR
ncbi:MAG: lactonase family protein [Acidobacteria bacterium]|nr:lactonase family protein [Acidobacteriota bacterium]